MRYVGTLIAMFALALLLLPGLTAQDKDKGDAKADKKDAKAADKAEPEKKAAQEKDKGDAKSDKKDAKDADKGEPEKKVEAKKEKKPIEEKPEHGPVVKTKIVSMRPDSAREFTIEVPMPDPQKIAQLQIWQMQKMQEIAQSQNPQQYAQRMAQYQIELAQRQTTTMKPVDVRAAEHCKVRSMIPPVQYDDAGNLKKYTQKELAAMKAHSKLPGFPAEFDLLKPGQYVEVYLAKQHTPPPSKEKAASKDKNTGGASKKKKMEEEDPVVEMRAEVVMIVIWAEPMGR